MLGYGWVIRLVMEKLVFEAWLALKSGPSSPRQVPGSSLETLPAALATASAEVLQMLGTERVTRGSAELLVYNGLFFVSSPGGLGCLECGLALPGRAPGLCRTLTACLYQLKPYPVIQTLWSSLRTCSLSPSAELFFPLGPQDSFSTSLPWSG